MRRFRFWQLVALFTVVAVALGSLAQTTWLWQCRYASTVIASTAGTTGQMPCRMVGANMSSMPCCRHMLAPRHDAAGGAHLRAPACNPKLVAVAVNSAARTHETQAPQLLTADAPIAPSSSSQPIVDHTLSSLVHPTGLARSSRVSPDLSTPTLRGPPA